jgi:hypothetical protein
MESSQRCIKKYIQASGLFRIHHELHFGVACVSATTGLPAYGGVSRVPENPLKHLYL